MHSGVGFSHLNVDDWLKLGEATLYKEYIKNNHEEKKNDFVAPATAAMHALSERQVCDRRKYVERGKI